MFTVLFKLRFKENHISSSIVSKSSQHPDTSSTMIYILEAFIRLMEEHARLEHGYIHQLKNHKHEEYQGAHGNRKLS